MPEDVLTLALVETELGKMVSVEISIWAFTLYI